MMYQLKYESFNAPNLLFIKGTFVTGVNELWCEETPIEIYIKNILPLTFNKADYSF